MSPLFIALLVVLAVVIAAVQVHYRNKRRLRSYMIQVSRNFVNPAGSGSAPSEYTWIAARFNYYGFTLNEFGLGPSLKEFQQQAILSFGWYISGLKKKRDTLMPELRKLLEHPMGQEHVIRRVAAALVKITDDIAACEKHLGFLKEADLYPAKAPILYRIFSYKWALAGRAA